MAPLVHAAVKGILAFGATPRDLSLDAYEPADPEHFGFRAQIFIGDAENDLSDSFDIVVCSPSWFAEEMSGNRQARFRGGPRSGSGATLPDSVVTGNGIWFMHRWDRGEFETAVRLVCDAMSPGPDWGSVASRVGRYIPWEYDYRYDRHVNERYGEPFPAAR